MDKKILIIVILSLIIIGLIWFIFARNSSTQAIIDEISEQRIQLIRSNATLESENRKITSESAELRKNNIESEQNNLKTEEDNLRLESENREYRRIIFDFRTGSKETKEDLDEYGRINSDLTDFIQQNSAVE